VQAARFAACWLIGLGLGVFYCFLRPLRPKFTALADGIFVTGALVGWTYAAFYFCRGDLRMGYTFGFLLVLLLTLTLHIFGTELLRFLRESPVPFLRFLTAVVDLRFFLLVGLQTMLFCAMFMYLPGQHHSFRESLPGALLGALGWMGASGLFSLYVEYFPRYANIFGSVYAVALASLWLYVCVSIVFYGALLNRILAETGK
jgi:YihY family inner membrane protein